MDLANWTLRTSTSILVIIMHNMNEGGQCTWLRAGQPGHQRGGDFSSLHVQTDHRVHSASCKMSARAVKAAELRISRPISF